MQNNNDSFNQYKATITLFGSNEVEKSTLITNLIYQLEAKCEKETPGCDIYFYNTKLQKETGNLDNSHSLLIRFIDVGKLDFEANKEQIKEISNISNIVCFIIEADNEKSIQYIETLTKIPLNLNLSNYILIIDITDKQKQWNTQLESYNKLLSSLKDTIEVSSNNKESIDSFRDFILQKITNTINNEKERYLFCEKEFNTVPDLVYVKKIKKTYACL